MANTSADKTESSKQKSTQPQRNKPPYPYITLIAMAISDSPSGMSTLAQINKFLTKNFEFFQGEYTGWKNSVRHNLSLNDCFRKVLRDQKRPWAKDNYWTLNVTEDYIFCNGILQRRRKRGDHQKGKPRIKDVEMSSPVDKNPFSMANLLLPTPPKRRIYPYSFVSEPKEPNETVVSHYQS